MGEVRGWGEGGDVWGGGGYIHMVWEITQCGFMYSADADILFLFKKKKKKKKIFGIFAGISTLAHIGARPRVRPLGSPSPPPISKLYEHYAQIPGLSSVQEQVTYNYD